ncbi:MAG: hypothetical protein MUD00_02935 [Candidatus Pacebacteria bacterium]|jgi:hypothetical protein|nr:hypothetical protein [Candidatus Paceibacterota bacterium]
MKTITAYVFASIDYTNNRTLYHVYTISDSKEAVKPTSVYSKPVETGLWDDVLHSKVVWADDGYKSMDELVEEIREGVSKYEIYDFVFSFDYPDHLTACFTRSKTPTLPTVVDNILVCERPLNENEREQFARAFAALPNEKES